jgi:hypothetical protein
VIKDKIKSLKEEIRSIDFADVLYWKWEYHSRVANAEYLQRRTRFRQITRELALWEKTALPSTV